MGARILLRVARLKFELFFPFQQSFAKMSKRAMTTKDAPKEAHQEMPQRPPNFYMQFRNKRMKELDGKENRAQIIKEEWEKMAPEVKEAESAKAKKEMEKYKALMAEWEKAHPGEKRKSKRRKAGDDGGEEKKEEEKPKGKGDKSNGAPKASRGPKKEEEKEEKEEKGKSKGKREDRGESKKPKK